jgi:hypothetical protein
MHGYVMGVAGFCTWAGSDGESCNELRGAAVHSPEKVAVDGPLSEVFRPVMDAPADDEGVERARSVAVSEGSVGRSAVVRSSEELALGLGWVSAEERELWMAMGSRLERMESVVWGAWPVRQFVVVEGSVFAEDLAAKFLREMVSVGEPFAVETQWFGGAHVLLFTYGDYYGSSRSEICSAVRRVA